MTERSSRRTGELDPGKLAIMQEARRIFCVSPHPDDTEFAAGGYVAAMVESGAKVDLVVVSDGSMGSIDYADASPLAAKRAEEQEVSAAILGIGSVTFLGFRDGDIPAPRELRGRILDLMRSSTPDLVLTTDPNLPYEAHLDHVNVGRAVMESVLLFSHPGIGSGKVRSPRPALALSATANPNVIFNVDRQFEKKIRAISAHRSQMDSSAYILETVKKASSVFGLQIGTAHGEPFLVLRAEEMHMNVFI